MARSLRALILEAKCPSCGSEGAHVGLRDVHCPNPKCPHFDPAQKALSAPKASGGWHSADDYLDERQDTATLDDAHEYRTRSTKNPGRFGRTVRRPLDGGQEQIWIEGERVWKKFPMSRKDVWDALESATEERELGDDYLSDRERADMIEDLLDDYDVEWDRGLIHELGLAAREYFWGEHADNAPGSRQGHLDSHDEAIERAKRIFDGLPLTPSPLE